MRNDEAAAGARLVDHRALRQFALFVLVGAASVSTTLATRWSLRHLLVYEITVAISQVVGMLVAFALNRRLVFPASGRPAAVELGKFAVVNAGSLVIAVAVSSFAYRLLLPWLQFSFHPELVAQIIGLGACAIPSFLAHKLFSFRPG